jgi:hypothetical protein
MTRTFSRLITILTLFAVALIAAFASVGSAQEATSTEEPAPPLPTYYRLENVRYEAQWWNNCGPATLTSALSYFGYSEDQGRAAAWLKPNNEDKNVSPWQMVEFVNTQLPDLAVFSLKRYGGDLTLLKTLIANDFPVIIEAGYDPEPDRLGWMGHYLFARGYDDSVQVVITNDSYLGEATNYSYDHIQKFWQHFNYAYIVLYESGREPELLQLLGDDADVRQNYINALEIARSEAVTDNTDAFAWFNMGTNFVGMEMYNEAAVAYDQARTLGLPWRMLWYQFGPLEAYNAVGRYDDTIRLAQANLNDGGGHFVEETFYYAGVAREGLGERERAIDNYRGALNFNPNFTPAREALERLGAS